jgi:hypothetical protein
LAILGHDAKVLLFFEFMYRLSAVFRLAWHPLVHRVCRVRQFSRIFLCDYHLNHILPMSVMPSGKSSDPPETRK